jgi:DNA-binding NarL/FixJ family response regulator
MPIRLVVKSRRRLVREAICGYLAGRVEFSVVGHAGSINALAELCTLSRPDVALVDAGELTVPTVEALGRVRSAVPGTEVVVTYADVSTQALTVAAATGITQLVPSSHGLNAVLHRVRQCALPGRRRRPDGMALTRHDVRLVALLSSGHGTRELADILRVSPRTVENHKRRLYAKLGVTSASHAVSRAASLGLIDQPPPAQTDPQDGRSPLIVVYGPDGPVIDAAMRVLIAAQLTVVRIGTPTEPGGDHRAPWHGGPIVAVLVDPTYDDWREQARLGARPIVVLSAEPGPAMSVDMLLRGAHALLRAEDVASDLASVLSVVVRGYMAVDAAQLKIVTDWMAARPGARSAAVPVLTGREKDILNLLASGRTIRQTGQALGISAKTVENAQGHLFRKLGVRNRAEALALAYRLGLLDLDS